MAQKRLASLWRRLAAAIYDAIICVALAMVITAVLLPFNDGLAFTPADWRYQICLVGLLYLFFVGFWVKCGQTAGMIAWKLKVCDLDGGPLNYRQASKRFFGMLLVAATGGLAMLMVWFNLRRMAPHDWLAGSVVVNHVALSPTPSP